MKKKKIIKMIKKTKNTQRQYKQHKKMDETAGINKLRTKIKELEVLVEIISKGKYQWQATFDAIASPVMIVSNKYKIERANLYTAEIIGSNIRNIIGKTCYKAFASRTAPCKGCPLTKSLNANKPQAKSIENEICSKEFEAYSYPYTRMDKVIDSVVMYYRDVTNEHKLLQEAMQKEKMAAIGLLAGGVAHEINNPLGGILALTQLLIRDVKNKGYEGCIDDLCEIEDAARRCKKIVADLLDFSRSSKKEDTCHVNINDLINKALNFVKMDKSFGNIEVKLNLTKKNLVVNGCPDKIEQVFVNLFTNASHAMSNKGMLAINTDVKNGKVNILVADTGKGIKKQHLKNIFEPFFTTKSPGVGTGLGLSIVYRIIKDHKGTIDVKSEQGKGTVFNISFPKV